MDSCSEEFFLIYEKLTASGTAGIKKNQQL
jgi:hypothetical protein